MKIKKKNQDRKFYIRMSMRKKNLLSKRMNNYNKKSMRLIDKYILWNHKFPWPRTIYLFFKINKGIKGI